MVALYSMNIPFLPKKKREGDNIILVAITTCTTISFRYYLFCSSLHFFITQVLQLHSMRRSSSCLKLDMLYIQELTLGVIATTRVCEPILTVNNAEVFLLVSLITIPVFRVRNPDAAVLRDHPTPDYRNPRGSYPTLESVRRRESQWEHGWLLCNSGVA